MEWELGEPGKAYSEWAAKMAVDLGTGVPWIMCKQDDVPDPIVSGFYSISLIFYFHCLYIFFLFLASFLLCSHF